MSANIEQEIAAMTYGQDAADAAEQTAEAFSPAAVNIDYSWLGFAAIAVIIVLGALAVVSMWKSRESTPKKCLHTVFIVCWSAVFTAIEWVLASFGADGHITASNAIYTASIACAVLGQAITMWSFVRPILPLPRKKRNEENADSDIAEHEVYASPSIITENGHEISRASRVQALDDKYAALLVPPSVPHDSNRFFQAARDVFQSLVPVLALFLYALICLMLLEFPSNIAGVFSIADPYMGCEYSVILGIVVGVWLICQRRPVGYVLPMAVALIYGLAEYFVETFKFAAIMPSDLRSMNTGMSVAGGYTYELTGVIVFCIAMFCVFAGAAHLMRDPLSRFLSARRYSLDNEYSGKFLLKVQKKKNSSAKKISYVKNAIACVLSVLLGIVCIQVPVSNAMTTKWEDAGLAFDYWQAHVSFHQYGIVPSFICALQMENPDTPEGYSAEKAQQMQSALADVYNKYIGETPERAAAMAQFDEVRPNIVMVMNESFADLSFLGELGAGYTGPSFINSTDAIARGASSVSVYGGGTCNSEFEGLTGTSLGYLGAGLNPYILYDLSGIDSYPKQLKKLGYETVAIHPEVDTNWGRDRVYPQLGFDKFISINDFAEDAPRSRDHITDGATYEKVIEQIKSSSAPQFVFDLTMQGHGGYDTGLLPPEQMSDYPFNNVVDDSAAAITNEYVSSLELSDQDLRAFVEELSALDEPTVLVFYGDHQPGFSWWYKDVFMSDASAIDAQQSVYRTDYMVWANYDIAGSAWTPSTVPETSGEVSPYDEVSFQTGEVLPAVGNILYTGTMAPASLMSWTMNFIGSPLTDYQKADVISRRWIQSNNIYGYMDAEGAWHDIAEADALEDTDIYAETMEICTRAMETGTPQMNVPAPAPVEADMPPVMAPGDEGEPMFVPASPPEEGILDGGYDIGVDAQGVPEDENVPPEGFVENIEEMPVVVDENVLPPEDIAPDTAEVAPVEQQAEDAYRDNAVLFNAMRWLAYYNFFEHIR